MFNTEIHIWGDSIAVGITYDERRKRYVISKERCPKRIAEGLQCKVVNNAKMGATVVDGLERFKAAAPAEGALCVIEYGGNDCNMDWAHVAAHPDEPTQPSVELSLFTKLLEEFIDQVARKNMKAMLVTPLPLHAQKFYSWIAKDLDGEALLQAIGDVQNIYGWQERYAIAVRNVAQKTKTPVLDLRDVALANRDFPSMICPDGIHLRDEGYRFLADYLLRRMKLTSNCL